jgi:hypothetical protein
MPTSVVPILDNGAEHLSYDCPVCGVVCESDQYRTTLVGYKSPPGHNHDDNCRTFFFACPSGHRFSVRPQNRCPTKDCAWLGEIECSICGENVQVQGR